ncbi:Anaerobic dehydrogenase, typically selenocysteine-containing (plasmid) [Phaeobacter inhibens]|uniref:Anaerobic dehydrogenase, typically selenocysteine-containing n=1 Tax=Phaeobacter inhibens TaxID=221822 RepID=A0ABM6RKG8_9RHOB|nr:molybdopterin-dependent oxidoreductase [Phaeobacter inhibens]AUQ52434.1 Anaerobic dehydrogenase, typically selenocysteine-containing [Phaeobacter inhibens]AUQ97039.1 Anaerobic dehydrogenase, typically selenocysteine-containing [Phaeobacter inhibens]AUR22239.1 Anaerobic dehydrogenase, typically selenocysteine-containing [Phaeobacter inhibens]
MTNSERVLLTATHWGTYRVDVENGRVTNLRGFEHDPDPSPIGPGIVDVLDGPTRITAPMVRKSWLEGGPGTAGDKRGSDAFVEVSWAEANRLVAAELTRVRSTHGNRAIYAGSYGWASAGRFHHAQSQLKRFLNCIGGYTGSKNTYSFAAAEVLVPHVLGTFRGHLDTTTSWESIASDCDLFVAFGGVPLKNGQISQGGTGAHVQKGGLLAAHKAGVKFVNISPLRADLLDRVNADWLPIRPNTDVALMLSLAHVLLNEDLHDQAFLDRYTVGFARFADYLLGKTDGIPKSPEWAADICEIPADTIRDLARRMARSRTMISTAWALTRQDHGEQPFWAAIALAAMLGQIGLPGTGLGFGYSAMNNTGLNRTPIHYASFPQGHNPVPDFIPVARVTDMLETPGGKFDYDGASYKYPDIRLVWWAGGNPFHHHQDLNRMRRAWAKPETIIANEWCWNALAKHADIVLPCTTPLERSDIALTPKDPYQVVMDQAIEPVGQARDDHEILRGIAAEMGVEEAFTEGRSPQDWQRWIWEVSRQQAAGQRVELPDWESLQRDGWVKVPVPDKPTVMLDAFRTDPEANPLATPSGRIEIFSQTIADFGYDDCPGHPAWMEPTEWLGAAAPDDLHMISNQPRNKLHSQLDHGAVSQADRPKGVEPMTMHPRDAAVRGLIEGQIVKIHNTRGACLAELRISDMIRPGAIQIATGAWLYSDGDLCRRGNPNVLTRDKGTSRLAQGPVAHSCLVKVETIAGQVPQQKR